MKHRVLIVEDDPATLASLVDYFVLLGCEVAAAMDHPAAAAHIGRSRFDSVITDVQLGATANLDGLRVLRAASELPDPPRTIVVLTGRSGPEVEQAVAACPHARLCIKPTPVSQIADYLLRASA